MTSKSVLLVFLVVSGCLSENQGPSVVTNSGKILGRYLTSYKGNKYEAYQGIPYALPPIGDRRFQPPEPIQPWPNQLKAVQLKSMCPQSSIPQEPTNVTHIGSEDCLYLNVYVPARKSNATLPVLLNIHGGAFTMGGAIDAEEQYIIDHEVIFVSIQYRLGLFGFLSTEDEVVSGNMGLKDQSVALRWVYENIEHFGGDQKKITLVGCSAGGMSVHHHYLSPWSRGLFHSGMSFSGTAFAPSAVIEDSRTNARELGNLVGCNDNEIRKMVECLKKRPTNVLLDAQTKLLFNGVLALIRFAPVVEKSATNPFLDDYPSQIMKKGKAYDVPWINGVVQEEGLVVVASYANNNTLKYIDANWNDLILKMLTREHTVPEEQHTIVAQKIRKHYFGDKPINLNNLHTLSDVGSDGAFKVSAASAAIQQAEANKSPVFFYYYTYRANDSRSNELPNGGKEFGPGHGEDVSLVLRNSRVTSLRDMMMQTRLIQLWTSVARYGVPKIGANWPAVSRNSSTLDYLHLAAPSKLITENSDNFGQIKFWSSINLSRH